MESMRLVDFVDPEGHSFRLLALDDNDVLVPPIPGLQENFPRLQEFKFRDDDVIITTYPRSGTHLIWEVIRMLRNRSPDYIKGEKENDFLEMCHLNDLQSKEDRVINTHLTPELLPVDWKNRKCKFVHVFRNPKDVMVSLYNMEINGKLFGRYSGTFSGFFEMAVRGHVEYGNWFSYELKYEKFFESNPNVEALVLSYEELTKTPVKSIKKVSDFLGLYSDDKLVASIADAISFSKMKAGKSRIYSESVKTFTTDEENNSKHYRKGVAGDWKNWFTVAQNERYDAEIQDRLKHSSIKSMIKWNA